MKEPEIWRRERGRAVWQSPGPFGTDGWESKPEGRWSRQSRPAQEFGMQMTLKGKEGTGCFRQRKLLIVGAGGQGASIADCALQSGAFFSAAFLDDRHPPGSVVMGLPVLGPVRMLMKLRRHFDCVHIALGENGLRLALLETACELGYDAPPLVHPSALVSPRALLEPGCAVLAGAVVGPMAVVGPGTIVNTRAVVEHHCLLYGGVHVSPMACLLGRVTVERGGWICARAVVLPGVTVGTDAVVGAGAVLRQDLPAGALAVGMPARMLERKKDPHGGSGRLE